MNILILVSSFLVILALGAYTLTKESTSGMQSQAHFSTFLALEKKAHNTIQRHLYRLASNKTSSTNEQKEKKEKILISRTPKNPTDQSKLNLAFLMDAPSPAFSARLYEIAASLLRTLYQETEIEKTALKLGVADFEYQLLDALIEKGKKEKGKKSFSFESLVPEKNSLKELYIKMVKGTRLYDLNHHKGYPPLSDFFVLDKDAKKKNPLFFCFASPLVLKAAFGDALGQHILDHETKGPLTKDELQALLSDYGDPNMQFALVQPLFSFSRKHSALKKIAVKDKRKPIFKKQAKLS